MAEYIYTIPDFNLRSTWNRAVDYLDGGKPYYQSFNITTGSSTHTVDISNIVLAEDEKIKSVVLTASIGTSGTSTSGKITVNGLSFGGTRKLDATTIVPSADFKLAFTYRASGDSGTCSTAGQIYSFSSTKTFSDVTLTILTGTGSVFDGEVSSLNEGDKIVLPEAEGKGTYTLVHHEYNTGKALIFRDDSIGTGKWRSSTPSYASSNSYIDSAIDKYFINTWYPTLPAETTQFLQTISYPVKESAHSAAAATTIDRTACTLSGVESGLGGNSNYGSVWNYTDTLAYDGSSSYWTREPVGGMANYARCITVSGTLSNSTVETRLAMRPTLGVLEEQLVRYSDSDVGYLLCSKCIAPDTLYINGSAANVTGLNREANLTLSWSAGTAGYNAEITGYAVWYSTSENGTYELYGTTTDTSMTIVGPEKHKQVYYFKVQTLGPEDTDYCNSELSSTYRSVATKTSNVSYYDGTKWLLATVKYYNGSEWVETDGAKYYDGSKWI